MNDFRKLIVWQKAMDLARDLYVHTSKFPSEEKFGLTSQMRRSAVSIPSNIAEGSKRGTKKDFTQFLRIAAGSAAELETQLLLSKELFGFDNEPLLDILKEVQKMLESLIKKL
ncbi:four helix bundle protein [Candidatus Kaiserbacteria bacterium]|nr:four helix bundle protein [Candidatus Kaiserbacteria bacterium]